MNGPKSVIVVVSGLPATGKTTLARSLALRLKMPLISKDDLKETLFDTLGGNDQQGSERLGAASVALLYRVLRANLTVGVSTTVESNFRPASDGPRLRQIADTHDALLVQVHCRCEGDVLLRRFLDRIGTRERHPGHGEIREKDRTYLTSGPSNALDLPGETVTVDTTDFGQIDEEEIVARVRLALS